MRKDVTSQILKVKRPLSISDINESMTLEEIEADYWGQPNFPSGLVTRCHELRKIPIGRLELKHLGVAIGQKISLPYLVPIALKYLKKDPLVESELFKGDLLINILAVPVEYLKWDKSSAASILVLANKARNVLQAIGRLDSVDKETLQIIDTYIKKSI